MMQIAYKTTKDRVAIYYLNSQSNRRLAQPLVYMKNAGYPG